MKKWAGFFLGGLGLFLWYYGGRVGHPAYVNFGIASMLLGLVMVSLSYDASNSPKRALPAVCSSYCEFIDKLYRDLDLRGVPTVIPPYQNLPSGALLISPSRGYSLSLGRLDGEEVLLPGGGLLVIPLPGWGIVEQSIENNGDLKGTGIGYASSAVLATLNSLGLPGGEVFELEDHVEVYVKYSCRPSIFDPAVGAVLMSVAIGADALYEVRSIEEREGYLKITMVPMGGIEGWM